MSSSSGMDRVVDQWAQRAVADLLRRVCVQIRLEYAKRSLELPK